MKEKYKLYDVILHINQMLDAEGSGNLDGLFARYNCHPEERMIVDKIIKEGNELRTKNIFSFKDYHNKLGPVIHEPSILESIPFVKSADEKYHAKLGPVVFTSKHILK